MAGDWCHFFGPLTPNPSESWHDFHHPRKTWGIDLATKNRSSKAAVYVEFLFFLREVWALTQIVTNINIKTSSSHCQAM